MRDDAGLPRGYGRHGQMEDGLNALPKYARSPALSFSHFEENLSQVRRFGRRKQLASPSEPPY